MKVLNNNADWKLLKEKYPHKEKKYLKILKKHYPIQYLIGNVDFYDSKLIVNKNVLIPRFETEYLVEKAIKYLQKTNYHTLLDIGTGSGAIAINIKKHIDIEVDACDISKKALKVAKKNAQINNVSLNFFHINILKEKITKKYDCIISNPPYVKYSEITSLETKYEPQIALYAKNEGLEFYERIIELTPECLNKNGTIILEIGATQKKAIENLVKKTYPQAQINTFQDYNHYDRYMFIKI